MYRKAKKNGRNDLTIETIEKFCRSAAKLRSCSIVSTVFLGSSMHDFLSSTEKNLSPKSWLL